MPKPVTRFDATILLQVATKGSFEFNNHKIEADDAGEPIIDGKPIKDWETALRKFEKLAFPEVDKHENLES